MYVWFGLVSGPAPSFQPILRRFFFFQAEDGIRDHCVTGVQTCALPIFAIRAPSAPPPRTRSRPPAWTGTCRSEERRVGKECRSRWSRYHLKKKKTQNAETDTDTDQNEDYAKRHAKTCTKTHTVDIESRK